MRHVEINFDIRQKIENDEKFVTFLAAYSPTILYTDRFV